MRVSHGSRAVVGAVVVLLVVAACGFGLALRAGRRPPPLVLRAPLTGTTVEPTGRGGWMDTHGCVDGDQLSASSVVDLHVTGVEFTGVSGAEPEELTAYVAWDPTGDPVGVGAGRPPAPYLPLSDVQAGLGVLHDCSLHVAAAIPDLPDRAVSVEGMDVTYRVDGHRHRTHVELGFAVCGAGMSATGSGGGDPCD